MSNRTKLHNLLVEILESDNVYFQPPETVKLNYPAIIYGLDDIHSTYANGGVYTLNKRYMITLVDKDPDSDFVEKISRIPTCRLSRIYKADNLNHFTFSIIY